jgi:hypothetical protein
LEYVTELPSGVLWSAVLIAPFRVGQLLPTVTGNVQLGTMDHAAFAATCPALSSSIR